MHLLNAARAFLHAYCYMESNTGYACARAAAEGVKRGAGHVGRRIYLPVYIHNLHTHITYIG